MHYQNKRYNIGFLHNIKIKSVIKTKSIKFLEEIGNTQVVETKRKKVVKNVNSK